ncbi:MAG: 50S ribosomal protein L10 [Spirochaetes bacterium]|jgi:large subunit ribosomal protein L10|nr:50S ribosomal protein L10 [Spirochaetota bacterium]
MVKQYKVDEVEQLVKKLNNKKNIILTHYSGVKVKDLSVLRKKLRAAGADYKVVKNNLFRLALKQTGHTQIDEHLKGPTAVAFMPDDIGGVAKILKEFKKDMAEFQFTVGIMDNVVYTGAQVEKIADLPSKEAILSQIMMLINAPLTQVATGMNQVIASLARGINSVAEKQGLQA